MHFYCFQLDFTCSLFERKSYNNGRGTDMVLRRSARSGEHPDFLSAMKGRKRDPSRSVLTVVSWRLFATACSPLMLMSNFRINARRLSRECLVLHFLRFLQAGHPVDTVSPCSSLDSGPSYGILKLALLPEMHFKILTFIVLVVSALVSIEY